MNEEDRSEWEPDVQPLHFKEEAASGRDNGHENGHHPHSRRMNERNQRHNRPNGSPPGAASVDAWCVLDVLTRRWKWLAWGACFMGALAGLAGLMVWKRVYTATAVLMRYDPVGMNDFFKPATLSADTFAGLLKAPELLERVAKKAKPAVSTEVLNKCVFVKPDEDSDMVKVGVKARNPQVAVDWANLYAAEAVRYTLDLQRAQLAEVSSNYLRQELTSMDSDINALQEQFKAMPHSTQLASKLSQISGTVSNMSQQLQSGPRTTLMTARLNERLQAAIDELGNLTRRYTDAHPLVQQERAQVESLEQQLAQMTTNPVAGNMGTGEVVGGVVVDPAYDIVRAKLQSLDNSREQLSERQREAQAYAANPPGNVKEFAPATLKAVVHDRRWLKAAMLSVFGGVFGLLLAGGGAMAVEFVDDRLKTADDVQRVTKLPVIGTLGDLNDTGPSARERWAFRTWTMLQGRLSPTTNQGLVCGITSSQPGEGRTTWIKLLAEAASMSGFRVLTVATKPSGGEPDAIEDVPEDHHMNGNDTRTLTTNVLSAPAQVTEQLVGPNSQPLVHIPLPGWVWNLERRMQWQEALNQWRQVDNLVILVELPPACVPEAVLLGQNLPNMVWLSSSGTASAADTKAQLETLRHARCRLVGAVLNREPRVPLKNRFPRWLGCVVLWLTLALGAVSVQAQVIDEHPPMALAQAEPMPAPASQEPTAPATPEPASPVVRTDTATNVSFGIVSPAQRGEWQKRLTLGPGDVLNFSLYGQPELTHTEVFIGPDGKVGYLEAQDVMASGLTVDELRTNMDQELSKYRRAPRTIITPVRFESKKYFMLGRVVQRGAYTLDQPITILEAVARAHGLETGLSDLNVLDLADFQKSFLMRHGKRIPINFEKLFQQGDLSQNIAIEPDDYLYFPSTIIKEVYVLGEVRFPGVVPFTSDLTVIGALSARGGFTDRAYKSRVLVIRGSLSNPKAFAVDTRMILDARGQDFQLQAKDIVFVSSRPFIRVEELVDLGITAFIQSVTAEWAGVHIGHFLPTAAIPGP